MLDNVCVCCGNVIPEGRQICKMCEEIHDEKQLAIIAKPAVVTNGDRIRAMTDEQLARFLCLVKDKLCFACKYEHVQDCEGISCEKAREQWLKQEAKLNG